MVVNLHITPESIEMTLKKLAFVDRLIVSGEAANHLPNKENYKTFSDIKNPKKDGWGAKL